MLRVFILALSFILRLKFRNKSINYNNTNISINYSLRLISPLETQGKSIIKMSHRLPNGDEKAVIVIEAPHGALIRMLYYFHEFK